MKRFAVYVTAFFFIMLTGCVKSSQSVMPEHLKVKDPRVFLMDFAARDLAVKSVKGLALVKVDKDGKGFEFEEVIIYKKPSSFRFETLSPMKTTLALIAGKNISVKAYMADTNTFYTAYLNRDTMQRLLFFPLEPYELFSILYGGIIPVEFYMPELDYDDSENVYLLTLSDGNLSTLKVRINPSDRTIKSLEKINVFTKSALIVSYDDYKTVNNLKFPMSIKIESPQDVFTVKLRYDVFDINTEIDESLFKIDAPKGAVRKFLE